MIDSEKALHVKCSPLSRYCTVHVFYELDSCHAIQIIRVSIEKYAGSSTNNTRQQRGKKVPDREEHCQSDIWHGRHLFVYLFIASSFLDQETYLLCTEDGKIASLALVKRDLLVKSVDWSLDGIMNALLCMHNA